MPAAITNPPEEPPAPEDVFRRRMKKRREHLGLRQQDLAEQVTELGVPMSGPAIHLIESGKTKKVSLSAAVAIAAVLDTPLEDLYRDRLDWDTYMELEAEDPGILEPLAWLHRFKHQRRKQRLNQSTPKEGQ